ncbi:MAG: RES family NAD+ phosphorylase [Nitriliruptorales bacterium]
MAVAWRISKLRHPAFDGTGARLHGARWNSPGREVVYASDTYAGAILEILAHLQRPRTLPGPHHAIRIDIPDRAVESLAPEDLPGWDARQSREARRFGDRWLDEGRSVALSVPSVPARPIGRILIINPRHPDAPAISVSDPFPVPWDERLF